MFYFSTPPYVSFAHPKATNAHSTMSLLLLLFFLNIFATYANCTAPLTNRNTQRENIHFFHNTSALYRRPNKTAKCNFSCFQILLCLLFFSFSLNFAHFERKHIRSCALLHAHTHAAVFLALTHSLSDMKLSLGDAKRQQRERKYKCSANGFCSDVTVAASVGDRWKR